VTGCSCLGPDDSIRKMACQIVGLASFRNSLGLNLFKAQWLLYVPPSLTFTNSTFCPHSVFMCFVDTFRITGNTLWFWPYQSRTNRLPTLKLTDRSVFYLPSASFWKELWSNEWSDMRIGKEQLRMNNSASGKKTFKHSAISSAN
jgi:hypothetical protein